MKHTGVSVLTYRSKIDSVYSCWIDISGLALGIRPIWRYGRHILPSQKSLTQLTILIKKASKELDLPILAPLQDGSVVTVAQLKLLPQTDASSSLDADGVEVSEQRASCEERCAQASQSGVEYS